MIISAFIFFLPIILINFITSKWPLFGKILSLIWLSFAVFCIGFIIAAIFSDENNDSAFTVTVCISIFIWIIGVWNIFGYLFQKKKNITPSSNQGTTIEIKELTLNEKIEFMDIGSRDAVILTFIDTSKIKIRLKNLARISHEIVTDFKKNDFGPGELTQHFIFLKDNYKTSLPPTEYAQLLNIIERFIREGGKVEIV